MQSVRVVLAAVLLPTLPGLMRYLESACAHSGYSHQKLVAVVVEVADERHRDAHAVQLLANRRHLGRRLGELTVMRTTSSRPAPVPSPGRQSQWRQPCRYWSSTAPCRLHCSIRTTRWPQRNSTSRVGVATGRAGRRRQAVEPVRSADSVALSIDREACDFCRCTD